MSEPDTDVGPGNQVELVPLRRTWDSGIMLAALLLVVSALVAVNGFTPPSHPLNGNAAASGPSGNAQVLSCDPMFDNCSSPSPCDPALNACPSPSPCDPSFDACPSDTPGALPTFSGGIGGPTP